MFNPRAFALFLTVALAAVFVAPPASALVGRLKEPIAAPEFTVKDLDGNEHALSEFKGKTVLLMFWATWCKPCLTEIPHLNALQKEYRDKGFAVLSISMDDKNPAYVKRFVEKAGVDYPVWMANADAVRLYGGITSIPTSFLIDKKGQLRTQFVGAERRETIERELKLILP